MGNPVLSDVIGAKLTCALLCNSLKVEGGSSVVSAVVSLRVRFFSGNRSLGSTGKVFEQDAGKSFSCYDNL